MTVSALNGFPPIAGLEAWQITAKSAAVGLTLLDRPDDHIVIACGSKTFKQTPAGEIVYPGPQAFTSAGVKISSTAGNVKAEDSELDDFVQGGIFNAVCTAKPGGPITATFNVQQGKEYTISLYWAETACASCPSTTWSTPWMGVSMATTVCESAQDAGRWPILTRCAGHKLLWAPG